MNHFFSFRFLPVLAGLALALPTASEGKDFKIRRDLDGDGHSNTKKIEVNRGRYDYGRYSGNRSYSRGYGYGSAYRSGFGSYGYNPYGYGSYGYRPYGYGYSSFYSPGVSFSYFGGSRSSYSSRDYSDDLAVDVQRALSRRGYYRGRIDGDIGPATRSAIRNYQANHRLSATGRVDSSLLRALDLD